MTKLSKCCQISYALNSYVNIFIKAPTYIEIVIKKEKEDIFLPFFLLQLFILVYNNMASPLYFCTHTVHNTDL